jgi:hypothetical protein
MTITAKQVNLEVEVLRHRSGTAERAKAQKALDTYLAQPKPAKASRAPMRPASRRSVEYTAADRSASVREQFFQGR